MESREINSVKGKTGHLPSWQPIRRSASILALLWAAVAAWLILAPLVPVASERFYLLVPPFALGAFVMKAPGGWKALRLLWPGALFYLVVFVFGSTLYCLFLAGTMLHLGMGNLLAGFSAREILIAVYFLVAVRIVLIVPLQGLGKLCHRVIEWPFRRQSDYSASHWAKWRKGAAYLLPVAVILPYLLATVYVHRFKVPNPPPPDYLVQRNMEDVTFRTTDGMTIRGWFIPAVQAPSERTLLICHGLGANRTNFLPFVDVGDELNANVLIFDFRGHGDSDGHTVSFGYWEKLDVLAAVDYLRSARPEQTRTLFGLGVSMGSSALIRAAAEVEPPFDAIILDSAFTSGVELTDSLLAAVPGPVRPLLVLPAIPLSSLEAGCWLPEVRPIDQVHRLRAPVLFIHAQGDTMIPAENSRRLYERAAEPKAIWIPDSGNHTSALLQRNEYFRRIRQLLEQEHSGGGS